MWFQSPLKCDNDEDGSNEDGVTNDDGGDENCIDVDNGDGVDEMSDTSDFC